MSNACTCIARKWKMKLKNKETKIKYEKWMKEIRARHFCIIINGVTFSCASYMRWREGKLIKINEVREVP